MSIVMRYLFESFEVHDDVVSSAKRWLICCSGCIFLFLQECIVIKMFTQFLCMRDLPLTGIKIVIKLLI